jgi:hypothetical protein
MLTKPKKPEATHFYHYSSAENLHLLEPILLKSKLYFPRPNELNDPTEAKPKFTVPSETELIQFMYDHYIRNRPYLSSQECAQIKETMIAACKSKGANYIGEIIVQYIYERTNNHRIYSMSKRFDNMSLWANYADNHKGYCLEFKNEGLFSRAYEVKYSDEVINFDITKPDETIGYYFFIKKRDWGSEEEIRIVTPQHFKHPIIFDSKLLTRLILGYQMSHANKLQIIEWAEQRSTPLVVVQTKYNDFEQKLELLSIG